MRRFRFSDLGKQPGRHVLAGLLEGEWLNHGGLSFHPAGFRTHGEEAVHTHETQEAFCILQGRGILELDGEKIPVQAGDVIIIEPGENHHLISSEDEPIINLWLHAGEEPHPNQR
ncbi:MAG TPA: cupin domain-containing protein [Caldilineae bacterium]|nr:cupin domain-containing protein [Caldilineae bacterium]